jgi:hypothetical protein
MNHKEHEVHKDKQVKSHSDFTHCIRALDSNRQPYR